MNPETSNVELALKDIHLPDSVLWWPPAPGWWIVFIAIFIIAVSFFIYKKTRYTRKLKKNIKLELVNYHHHFKHNGDSKIFIQQLSALLRRVALYKFSEPAIAKLHGNEWLDFLDSKLPEKKLNRSPQFSFKNGAGKIFLLGPYQAEITEDVSSAYELVVLWLNYNLKNKYGFL
ncbi:MAG: DUF4381 domain-containing protein [Gammaproteobacteria bacterium]